ncbi:phosphatidylinositol-3-phosphatase ymr1, partial [Coemansia sp. RSA 475]
MDHIRVSKVEQMRLVRSGNNTEYVGTLHLTTHHMIFSAGDLELWIPYPMIHSAVLVRPPRRDSDDNIQAVYTEERALEGSIRIRCHHFLFVTLRCTDIRRLYDVFATVKHLACVGSLEQLYAFDYRSDTADDAKAVEYDAHAEFRRMGVGVAGGVGQHWRVSEINREFQLCATYPPVLAIPARISDTTLTYAARYRSKARLPVLSYLHPNGASMTRSSQPMVGLKQARSVQDEKLVEAIVATSEPTGIVPRFRNERNNIIIDARPTTNAVVNRAIGAGSENMDHYRQCRKVYLGIDNIHVMRDALNRLADAAVDAADVSATASDLGNAEPAGMMARIQSSRSSWLSHLQNILVGVKTIVEAIDAGHHVLVHCSDGWDRTAQLTSLAQLCLDPYYRTIEGFAVLVEKEWVSFGHQFTLRNGHLGHPDRFTVVRAGRKRVPEHSEDIEDIDRDVGETESADDGAQTGSSIFGRFATRAFRGVQSRISSAIQTASDNLDDIDYTDTFFAEYPELHPDYVRPVDPSTGTNAQQKRGFRLGRTKHDRETSPVFQQFLDCVYQLWVQHPTMFEFNERFMLDLFYHGHAAQFGTFLGNNMQERTAIQMQERTQRVWSVVGHDPQLYRNAVYLGDEAKREQRVILPEPRFVQYWSA